VRTLDLIADTAHWASYPIRSVAALIALDRP
jgi:hypothetical protein